MKAAESPVLRLDGALVFFDLAGTLVEPDAPLRHDRQAILRRMSHRVGRFVLVTGQPLDDPQVQEFLSLFTLEEPPDLVVYATRGGVRLECRGGTFRKDLAYLAETRLDDAVWRAIEQEVAYVLEICRLRPLIPVQCLDTVAVRVNLPSAERPRLMAALMAHFEAVDLSHLQVKAEGRTSVFVMLPGVGKRRAVQYELERARREGFVGPALYFGNEVAAGNDREVLGLPGLEICALGPCGQVPPDTRCRTIGQVPDDLYAVIAASLDVAMTADRHLPVVCLSLGGTKVEVGALTQRATYLASPAIHWRDSPAFSRLLDDVEASHFCEVFIRHIEEFLERQGYTLADVGVLGVAFPGPQDDGRWYSNNLIPAFRKGVVLERALAAALARLNTTAVAPLVRVLFDAQCDAGGELYHLQGRLRSHGGLPPPRTATVLNVASGIAAGFVREGKVLVDDRDFRIRVHGAYDGGAGQLGRHLWYDPDQGQWRYHFCPRGRTPDIDPPATRMTERLSGPALAARLVLRLGGSGLLPHRGIWTVSGVTTLDVAALYQLIATCDPNRELAPAAQAVRYASRPVAGAILTWADDIYRRGSPPLLAACIQAFAAEVAAEFAGALTAWMSAPGWEDYGRYIVLTGTVGIRFLASSDAIPQRSFLHTLGAWLPAGCRVERSRLLGAAERECYLFLHQPATHTSASAGQVRQ